MAVHRFLLGLVASVIVFPEALRADVVCPDSSYVEVDYACTFTGTYRTGEPRDVITVAPDGSGETLAENGITVHVYLRDCQGEPVVGVPAESIALAANYVCICEGGNFADGPTDEFGHTTFTGTLTIGGCAGHLILLVDDLVIGTVPVWINSPDDPFAWACVVSVDEAAQLAGILSSDPVPYSICWDFNEDGSVDGIDAAILVSRYIFSGCSGSQQTDGRIRTIRDSSGSERKP